MSRLITNTLSRTDMKSVSLRQFEFKTKTAASQAPYCLSQNAFTFFKPSYNQTKQTSEIMEKTDTEYFCGFIV